MHNIYTYIHKQNVSKCVGGEIVTFKTDVNVRRTHFNVGRANNRRTSAKIGRSPKR